MVKLIITQTRLKKKRYAALILWGISYIPVSKSSMTVGPTFSFNKVPLLYPPSVSSFAEVLAH